MSGNEREWLLELEEEAEGVELYRTPGRHLLVEEAAEQAEAAGRVPGRPLPGMEGKLSRVRSRRQDLHDSMDYLEYVTAKPVSTERWAETVEAALLRLATAVWAHVAEAEGADGLLGAIVDAAPDLAPRVSELQAEHAALIDSAERALHALEDAATVDTRAVRRRVVALLGRLARHRQHGADLVYDAYNVDIGAAD